MFIQTLVLEGKQEKEIPQYALTGFTRNILCITMYVMLYDFFCLYAILEKRSHLC